MRFGLRKNDMTNTAAVIPVKIGYGEAMAIGASWRSHVTAGGYLG